MLLGMELSASTIITQIYCDNFSYSFQCGNSTKNIPYEMEMLMESYPVIYKYLIKLGLATNATVFLEINSTCFPPDYAYIINNIAPPFAKVVISIVTIAFIIMNLFWCCSSRSER